MTIDRKHFALSLVLAGALLAGRTAATGLRL